MLTTSTQAVLTIITCSGIAGLWAIFRPNVVRDNDGRKLPPNVIARLTFTILFVFAYLAIAAAFLFGGFFVKSVSELMGPVPMFLQEFDDQAFVLALFATLGLYSFAPFREMERNVLSWMHDTRHLRGNVQALAAHLEECAFNISLEEHDRNLKALEASGIYVTDSDARGINLGSVIAWRKTAFLLRRLYEWNTSGPRVLSREEMDLLREFEGAHVRRARLAMDIARRESSEKAGALPTDMLARAWHGNRPGVVQQEAAQVTVGSESGPGSERPQVRLTAGQLQHYLKKIEGYIVLEYKLMLERLSWLAARSVMYAGDAADHRLEQLKAAGFEGLGSLRPWSARRVLWMFLLVAVGGFLTYYLLWYDIMIDRLRDLPGRNLTNAQLEAFGQTSLIGIGFFVTAIAFAALIAALFASSSAHARAKKPPWRTYILAGLIAVIVYFVVQLIREVVTYASGLGDNLTLIQASNLATRIRASAPWCTLPFFTTVGICWLARQPPWQPPLALGKAATAILQRVLDGVVIGLLMIPAFSISITTLVMSGFGMPLILDSRFDPAVLAILGMLGFLVGATVVRDVRLAAHTQVILHTPHQNEEAKPALAVASPTP